MLVQEEAEEQNSQLLQFVDEGRVGEGADWDEDTAGKNKAWKAVSAQALKSSVLHGFPAA